MDKKETSSEKLRIHETSVDSEPIKVTDRRKFDRSGRLRGNDPQENQSQPQDKSSSARPEAGSEVPSGPEKEQAAPASSTTKSGASTPRPSHEDEVTFQSFVYHLWMSALVELGMPTEQGGTPRPPDPERARYLIDAVQVLEEKTKGNFNQGEAKILEEALYDLRMRYVAVSQDKET